VFAGSVTSAINTVPEVFAGSVASAINTVPEVFAASVATAIHTAPEVLAAIVATAIHTAPEVLAASVATAIHTVSEVGYRLHCFGTQSSALYCTDMLVFNKVLEIIGKVEARTNSQLVITVICVILQARWQYGRQYDSLAGSHML
jgi:hypothetical protein